MSSKMKLVLLALVAVCAVGAVMAASASALELELYLIEGHSIHSGESVPVEIANGTATLVGTGLEISCTKVESEAKLLTEGKSDEKAQFTSCTVVKPTSCTVKEPIEVNAIDQALLFNGKPADTFSPRVGTTLTTLRFSGSGCSLSTLAVTGSAQALIEQGGEEQKEHELVFSASSGEDLEVGGSAATLKLKSKAKLGGTDAGKAYCVHMS